MKYKKLISVSGMIMCLLLLFSILNSGCGAKPSKKYGVFLGLSGKDMGRLQDYNTVVIEPSEFEPEQIKELRDAGKTVYAYLNIGAIEEYRSYYDRFKEIMLDVYKNWEDERWIDVSDSRWQSFIIGELGKTYAGMGFDGFFLDNADVYYNYPTEDCFDGLSTILKGLKTYNIKLIINGGDAFVSRCMDEGISGSLFDGVNQETVFTSIDFKNKTYGSQREAETLYFKEYLARAKAEGLSVYLLEYGANSKLAKVIDSYCRDNSFIWYNAESLELK